MQARQNLDVATMFGHARCLPIRPPHEWMEPPDNLRRHLQQAEQPVPAPNVDEFMSQNRFEILGPATSKQALWNDDYGPQ